MCSGIVQNMNYDQQGGDCILHTLTSDFTSSLEHSGIICWLYFIFLLGPKDPNV